VRVADSPSSLSIFSKGWKKLAHLLPLLQVAAVATCYRLSELVSNHWNLFIQIKAANLYVSNPWKILEREYGEERVKSRVLDCHCRIGINAFWQFFNEYRFNGGIVQRISGDVK
jgi:hypothetical protein